MQTLGWQWMLLAIGDGAFGKSKTFIPMSVSPVEFARGLQNLVDPGDIVFMDQDSIFPLNMAAREFTEALVAVMLDWNALRSEVKSEGCLPLICPPPQSGFANSSDDFRGLVDVDIASGFINVRFEFGHPHTERNLEYLRKQKQPEPAQTLGEWWDEQGDF